MISAREADRFVSHSIVPQQRNKRERCSSFGRTASLCLLVASNVSMTTPVSPTQATTPDSVEKEHHGAVPFSSMHTETTMASSCTSSPDGETVTFQDSDTHDITQTREEEEDAQDILDSSLQSSPKPTTPDTTEVGCSFDDQDDLDQGEEQIEFYPEESSQEDLQQTGTSFGLAVSPNSSFSRIHPASPTKSVSPSQRQQGLSPQGAGDDALYHELLRSQATNGDYDDEYGSPSPKRSHQSQAMLYYGNASASSLLAPAPLVSPKTPSNRANYYSRGGDGSHRLSTVSPLYRSPAAANSRAYGTSHAAFADSVSSLRGLPVLASPSHSPTKQTVQSTARSYYNNTNTNSNSNLHKLNAGAVGMMMSYASLCYSEEENGEQDSFHDLDESGGLSTTFHHDEHDEETSYPGETQKQLDEIYEISPRRKGDSKGGDTGLHASPSSGEGARNDSQRDIHFDADENASSPVDGRDMRSTDAQDKWGNTNHAETRFESSRQPMTTETPVDRSKYLQNLQGELLNQYKKEDDQAKRMMQIQQEDEALARKLQQELDKQSPPRGNETEETLSDNSCDDKEANELLAKETAALTLSERDNIDAVKDESLFNETSIEEQKRILEQIQREQKERPAQLSLSRSSEHTSNGSVSSTSWSQRQYLPPALVAFEEGVLAATSPCALTERDSAGSESDRRLQCAFQRQFRPRTPDSGYPGLEASSYDYTRPGPYERSYSSGFATANARIGSDTRDYEWSQRQALMEYQRLRQQERQMSGVHDRSPWTGRPVPPVRNSSNLSTDSSLDSYPGTAMSSPGQQGITGAPSSQTSQRMQSHPESLVRRGILETERAVQSGKAHVVNCQGCGTRMQAPIHYSLVYCQSCGVVSPGIGSRQPYAGASRDFRHMAVK